MPDQPTTGGTSALDERGPTRTAEAQFSERYYDARQRRLVYIGSEASPEMWDGLWDADEASVRASLQPSIGHRWLIRITGRYLKPSDGPILEGGCGAGHYVAALQRQGYQAVGIDSAPKTVALVNRVAPALDIRLGDVRRLPFETASMAGYWSLGVIEHFYDGYQPLADEMARVLRPGGYLFLAFPFMSPVRRLKARLGFYPRLESDREPPGFYQFALDASRVAADIARLGFRRHSLRALSGLQGCKDEIAVLRAPLQAIYGYSGRSIVPRGLRWALAPALAAVGTGHSCVMVFERTGRTGS